MALRNVALWRDKLIGIESIYTVVNGQQINIEEKLRELRIKSRNNELFCPCGCGANLTVVAGDRNLREQHFRIKSDSKVTECNYKGEGPVSAYSKIVLKCWLEDKLEHTEVNSRVPISDITESNRRYEFSFYANQKRIALSYCHKRENLSDDKLEILDAYSKDIKIIYVTDIENSGEFTQYPEYMMKIQKRQGYCLYLKLGSDDKGPLPDYDKAEMAVFYYKHDTEGRWRQIGITSGMLSEYSISSDGIVFIKDKSLESLLREADERDQEYLRKLEIENQNRLKEIEKQQEQKRIEQEEKEKARLVWIERHRLLQRQIEEQTPVETPEDLEKIKLEMSVFIDRNPNEIAEDKAGRRWIKCEICGKLGGEGDFCIYGGKDHVSLGTCNECDKKGLKAPKKEQKIITSNMANDVCPKCGGKLVQKNGKYGPFMGCSNYRIGCRFTRNVYG